jgi:cytochrome c peroxidase
LTLVLTLNIVPARSAALFPTSKEDPMVRNTTAALFSLGRLIALPALAQDDLMAKARQQFEPIPATPPELPGNPASPAKVELGKMLFFEPRLSASHIISCNSCHNLGLGGADTQSTSIGHRWQHGGRNAPTVLNAVFNKAQFWDGRAKDLEQQAGGPMVNPVEMASPEAHVAEQLKGIPGYGEAFAKTFPGEPDPITFANVQKAIAVFEATLITPNAPFDRFLKGEAGALSPAQKSGLALSWIRVVRPATTASTLAAACTPPSGWSRNRKPNFCRQPTKAVSWSPRPRATNMFSRSRPCGTSL